MFITRKNYEKWRDMVFTALDIDKVLPKQKPIYKMPIVEIAKRMQLHKRAKLLEVKNMLTGKTLKIHRELPKFYQRGFCFNDAYIGLCPNPFSLDLYRGGFICYGCVYCFAIRCEYSILSAFYDTWKPGMVSPVNIEKLKEDWYKQKYSDSMVGRAIRRRLVLHVGNNIENFIPAIEKRTQVGYKFLELMRDENYHVILNTKSDLWDDPKYFNLLSEMADHVMVQMTIVTPYDDVAKKIEPFAPSVSRRLEVMKTLNESGIKAVVRAEPLIYGVSPTDDEGLEDFANKLLDASIPYINVGAFNQSVRSPEIERIWSSLGYAFETIFFGAVYFYQTLTLEKAMFKFKEMGLKVGSFNPATYSIQDAYDCCGYAFDDEPIPEDLGLDNFNIVEIARELAKRGKMSWDDVMRWAKPIYSKKYVERMRKEVWNCEGFPVAWWGNFTFRDKVHGAILKGYDENGNAIYVWSEKDIIKRHEEMVDIFTRLMK